MPPVEPNLNALNALLDRILKKVPSGDGPITGHYRALFTPVSDVTDGANALHKLAITRDPRDTDAVHFKHVSAAAVKVARQIDLADSAVKVARNNALADIKNRVTTKLNFKPDGFAPEIRTAFRQRSRADQAALLTELVADPMRGPELAAILRAPTSLTGLTELQIEQYYDAYRATHAAPEIAEEELVEETFASAMTSLETAREIAAAHTDEAKLADILRREQAALEAAVNFISKVKV